MEQLGLLEPIPDKQKISIVFRGLCAWAKNVLSQKNDLISSFAVFFKRDAPVDDQKPAPAKKQILFDLHGAARPGEVMALMGPSGSGKTTLVRALAGRLPREMESSGDILVNDGPMSKSWRKRIGFVPQDDVLYASLTVYETLYFAALLCLPSNMTRSQKENRVEEVIRELGLNKCRGTLIGNAKMKGVSGGERKRVAVGHELVMNPSCLILDEPTSGLDSTRALHLMTILKGLARGGRSIIATIHQPSSRLFQQLDTLMLLSEGHTIYNGRAELALSWFKSIGYCVPLGLSTADYIVDLANGDMGDEKGCQKELVEELIQKFLPFNTRLDGITSKSGLHDEMPMLSKFQSERRQESFYPVPLPSSEFSKVGNIQPDLLESSSSPWGASFWEQTVLLTKRAIRVRRFDSVGFLRFIQVVAPGVVGGLLWWQSGGGNTVLGALNVSALIFFQIVYIHVRSAILAIRTFPPIYQMTTKERASGMYRLSALYFGLLISDFPLECAFPSIYIALMYWFGGLRPTMTAFLGNWLSTLLGMFIAQSIGLILGAVFMVEKSAIVSCAMIFITSFMTGGFYIREVPNFASWLRFINANYYNFNIAMKMEFSGRTFVNCGGLGARVVTSEEDGTCIPVTDLKESLSFIVDVDEPIWFDVGIMLLMLVFYRFLLYHLLRMKTRT